MAQLAIGLEKRGWIMPSDPEKRAPMIFLAGPPGTGKSSLGRSACQALHLRFLDLSTPAINEESIPPQRQILAEAIDCQSADIVALPWALQNDRRIRSWIRRSGVLLLLWAHPLEMQERSGHSEPPFTPSRRIKSKEGFGRYGTGCLEFRSLERGSDEVLMLVGLSFDEAVHDLEHRIVAIREESTESPVIRAGLSDWAEDWQQSYDIEKDIVEIIVDAMARYVLHLRSEGKSQRTLSGVYSDLQAAGLLVLMYDYPKRKKKPELLDFSLFLRGR